MKNLLFDVQDEIAILTINRPQKLNALNTETLCELDAILFDLEQRSDVNVIILTGSGNKAFGSGADISEMVDASAAEGHAMSLLATEAFNLLENMHQVTIAAVNGFALGGSCELAMACDIRVASVNARFGHPECRLGIIPGFGGTQRLSRLIGKARAKELIFTGYTITAKEAYHIGLVNRLTSPTEVLSYCNALAKRIINNNNPLAISLAKQAINTGLDTDLSSGLKLESSLFGMSFSTLAKKESMTAFLEKRQERINIVT
jgi:enoyl-CoA hydratase